MPRLLQRQRLYRRLFVAATIAALALAGIVGWQRTLVAKQRTLGRERFAQLERTRRDANLGNRAREQAEDLAAFMLDDLRGQLVPLGRTGILGDAARRTLDYFENLPPELATPVTLEARASILGTLASVHHDRGELEQAAARWRESIGIRRQLLEARPDAPGPAEAVADATNALALVLLDAGDVAAARSANLEALEGLDRLAATDPRTRAATLYGLGECERATANPEGAINYYKSAIAALGEPDPEDVGALQTRMTCHNNIGICEMDFGDLDAAREAYAKALAPARRLLELQPEERHWQREIATLLNNLGTIHDERGEFGEARPFLVEALQLRQSLVAWDPANSGWQLHLANSLRNLGSLELSDGNPNAAVDPVHRSLRVRLDLLAREPDNTPWLEELQAEARRFADRFDEAGRPELARAVTEAVRTRAESLARDAVDSAAWNQFLSRIYNDLGHAERVADSDPIPERLRSTALRAANVQGQPDDPERLYQLAAGYLDLAEDLIGADRFDEAFACLRLSRFLLQSRIPERFYRRESLIALCLRHESRLRPDPASETLVPDEASWKYYDHRNLPGDDWHAPDFDDSTWKEGPAQLGYGDGDEATLLDYGSDPDHKNLSAWFRHRFEARDAAAMDPVRIGLLCDDGARVFLNGREIIRHGLPDGPVSPTTVSNLTVSGLDEEIFHVFTFRAEDLPLREGPNVLAAEVHQNEGRSSDLSFALEFLGRAPIPPPLENLDLAPARQLLGEALPEVVETWISESPEPP